MFTFIAKVYLVVIFSVTSFAAPTIEKQLVNRSLKTGDPLSLEFAVNSTDTPSLHYQWYKNGEKICCDRNYVWKQEVSTTHVGEYHVVAIDSTGSVTSEKVTVIVDGQGPSDEDVSADAGDTGGNDGTNTDSVSSDMTIKKQLVDRNLQVGDPLSLEIAVVSANASSLHYQWYKDGIKKACCDRNYIWKKEVEPQHAGEYYVVVTNGTGSITSKAVNVIVTNLEQPTEPGEGESSGNDSETLMSPAYFVHPEGDDNWSGLSESPGATDGPFRTIAKALDAMKTSTIKRTYVREGLYNVHVELTSADSGVQLLAYPNEKPTLTGGRIIAPSSWQQENDGSWSAPVSVSSYDIGTLTVNGEYYVPARHPNVDANATHPNTTGWLLTESSSANNQFKFRTGSLTPEHVQGMTRIVVWDKFGWKSDVNTIASIDYDSRILTMNGKSQFGMDNKSRFYILYGGKAAFDAPGEFWHDRQKYRIYFRPKQNTIFNGEGAVYTRANESYHVIHLNGTTDVEIRGFRIQDQFSLTAANAGIQITGGARNVIAENELVALGTAMALRGTQDNVIKKNEIHHTTYEGITFVGAEYSGGNEILANHIHRVGQVNSSARGIRASYGANRIAYNLIEETYHYGIEGGGRIPSAGLIIEYNELRRNNLHTWDCGAIYLKNHGDYDSPEIVRYNRIKGSGGLKVNDDLTFKFPDYSWGIYLDEGQSGTKVYGNFISDTSRGAVFTHRGSYNEIYNNLFLNSSGDQYRLANNSFSTGHTNQFHNNVVQFSGPASVLLRAGSGREGTHFQNVFWYTGTGGANYFETKQDLTPKGNFSAWQRAGFDVGSVIADPQFVNPSAGDYRLKSESPALDMGFLPLPFQKMGLQGYDGN